MDLSKTFYCVLHDPLLAKLVARDLDESFLCYKYSYLLNRKQYVPTKTINSIFVSVIQVPNKDIQLGRSYLVFFNDFFYVIETANAHNFAEDNKLTSIANNIKNVRVRNQCGN